MSKFSGKHDDFYDKIEILGLDKILQGEVYVDGIKEPLKLTCVADCVPYYPYVVSACRRIKNSSAYRIYLMSKSWIDIEEERFGHFTAHDYYRKLLQEEIKKYSCIKK